MSRPLIEVTNLSKSYGTQEVLVDISFQIHEGQKIALIGRNGAGKSTLMRILTEQEEKDTGEVLVHEWAALGIINQHEVLPSDRSALEYIEKESQKPDWEIKKIAHQFALWEEHLEKTPQELSGGYQMRVKLVTMLAKDPNILLLDEPINYLDLQTLILLERFLQSYKGATVIIAHDRTFLEKTCTYTMEIERTQIKEYKGTVHQYADWKKEQQEFTLKKNKKLAREISHQQKFVDRFRYKASLASQAQSKLKYITRLRRELEEIQADLATSRIQIPCPDITKGLALRAEELQIGYERPLAENITFDIMRGDHILIAGENGSGKSTLLKTLTGEIEPLGGHYKWWHRTAIGYFNQFTEKSLNAKDTVLSHLQNMAPKEASGEQILMMAGNFLFKGDDLDKSTSVLSGGERARLCLAGILLHNYNTLIFDEPSNHLDMETSTALERALREYKGTIIFVSHAQGFAKNVAHKILEIRDNRIREFMGDYNAYVQELEEMAKEEIEEDFIPKKQKMKGSAETANRKDIHLQIRGYQREQKKVQEEMEKLENKKGKILMFFFENPTDYSPEKQAELHEIENQLDQLERQWVKHEENIEQKRKELI